MQCLLTPVGLRYTAAACPLAVFASGDGPVPQQGTATLRMSYPGSHQTCSVEGQVVNISGFAGQETKTKGIL